ncbi:PREDICTED: uncharacterized protein LOC108766484 [Trachymyrmex cornetzi]|uniref:uncharacterized protein LOC108766484 n=1 Tax=Trachymyrmex cornetzi TaxID=471704 RepID=UPI00084F60D8|nr:PREDICTED: uncharacterized protein LOC108766484 [Trachymyrmex cornetzi]
MKDCKYSPKLADPPIRFEKPVYGTTDLNYADFLAPSYMLILIFSLTTTVSTSVIIADRLEGVWDRSIVQGVRTDEILLSHILIQSIIIIIHTTMIMLLYFSIWGLECKGSIFDVIILTFLTGFCGLMYGFVISIMWKNYTMANYTSTGSFLALILLSDSIGTEPVQKVCTGMVLALYRKLTRLGVGNWYWGSTGIGTEPVQKVCTGIVLALYRKLTRLGVGNRYWGSTGIGTKAVLGSVLRQYWDRYWVQKVCIGPVLALL